MLNAGIVVVAINYGCAYTLVCYNWHMYVWPSGERNAETLSVTYVISIFKTTRTAVTPNNHTWTWDVLEKPCSTSKSRCCSLNFRVHSDTTFDHRFGPSDWSNIPTEVMVHESQLQWIVVCSRSFSRKAQWRPYAFGDNSEYKDNCICVAACDLEPSQKWMFTLV